MTPRPNLLPRAASRLSRAALWLGGALLAVTAVSAALSVQREEALRQEIARSYEARQSLLQLFSLLQDAETGQRGYLLTGDPGFLGPYLASQARSDEQRKLAVSYFRSESTQSQRIEHLERLTAAKWAELARTLTLSAEGQRREALDLVASGQGQRLMAEIRAVVSELSAAESAQLNTQREARNRLHAAIVSVGAALIVLLLGLLVSGLMREHRGGRERKQLEESLADRAARLSAVFESASDGILTLNPSGSIETINPAGALMFGYGPEELLRRDVSVLAEVAERGFGTFHERLVSGDATLESGIVREVTARRKDGTPFPVDVALRGMPLPDGMHIVAVVRDISERRRAETLKEEFVSTVSHELRTPLTSIAGALGLLRSGAAGILPERAGRLVQIAEANSSRLVRLINNILDIEKLEAGEMRLSVQPQFMNELAQRAVDAMSGLTDERGIRVEIDCPGDRAVVAGDADRLMQVLTNLLSNAVKVSSPGEPVVLKCSTLGDMAALSVIDRGPGVPESFRPRLFQKFAQADGSDAKAYGGTGLGLAIAREIAERHAGRLTYAPTPGGGATFTLELPLSVPPSPDQPAPSQSRKLLVCEDDPLTADYLRDELTGLDYLVDVVGSANEARLALHSGAYAALLLDVHLPDVDGLTLVRALRAAPGTRGLPIIIISGAVDDGNDGRLLDVVDWIDKPVDLARVRRALSSALEREGLQTPLILHVDDDRDLLEVTRAVLGGAGEVLAADSLKSARAILASRRPDVVILDLGLPDGSGVDLIPDLAELGGPPVPVIIYTAQEPGSELESLATGVFTKSRVGLQRLADTVSRITSPGAEGRG